MAWEYRHHRGWTGAAILIAVGVIGLLANFDLLPRNVFENLWKLWPLIPLAIGLSIVFGRRRYIGDRSDRDVDHR